MNITLQRSIPFTDRISFASEAEVGKARLMAIYVDTLSRVRARFIATCRNLGVIHHYCRFTTASCWSRSTRFHTTNQRRPRCLEKGRHPQDGGACWSCAGIAAPRDTASPIASGPCPLGFDRPALSSLLLLWVTIKPSRRWFVRQNERLIPKSKCIFCLGEIQISNFWSEPPWGAPTSVRQSVPPFEICL